MRIRNHIIILKSKKTINWIFKIRRFYQFDCNWLETCTTQWVFHNASGECDKSIIRISEVLARHCHCQSLKSPFLMGWSGTYCVQHAIDFHEFGKLSNSSSLDSKFKFWTSESSESSARTKCEHFFQKQNTFTFVIKNFAKYSYRKGVNTISEGELERNICGDTNPFIVIAPMLIHWRILKTSFPNEFSVSLQAAISGKCRNYAKES